MLTRMHGLLIGAVSAAVQLIAVSAFAEPRDVSVLPGKARFTIDGPAVKIPTGTRVVVAGTGALSRALADVAERRGRHVEGPAAAWSYLKREGFDPESLRIASEADLSQATRTICKASSADWVVLNVTQVVTGKVRFFSGPSAINTGRSVLANCGTGALTIQPLNISMRLPVKPESIDLIAADWGAELFP